jgi:hypothetical protein
MCASAIASTLPFTALFTLTISHSSFVLTLTISDSSSVLTLTISDSSFVEALKKALNGNAKFVDKDAKVPLDTLRFSIVHYAATVCVCVCVVVSSS